MSNKDFSTYWGLSQDSQLTEQEIKEQQEQLKDTPVTYAELAETMDTLLANLSLLLGAHQMATELKLNETTKLLAEKKVFDLASINQLNKSFEEIDKLVEDGMENE